ncbi:unnamed protein product [Chironomus riparius]|uniref:Uncharacterized protein n=1 Tax=Chironomus riparius TaxID=315576 RepID=A0A9N9S918_9DIPT|nr:unnamed protein product [Chironomus riparius]
MKLVFVAILIIGTSAGSPGYNFFPTPSALSCGDIETLVNQLSPDAREALKSRVLDRPGLLNLGEILGGNLLVNLLDSVVSSLNILNLDKILLDDILRPLIVMPDRDFNTDPSWRCLVNLFESED